MAYTSMGREPIQILSESPIDQLWLHLCRLESVPLATKAVAARAEASSTEIASDLLKSKGIGVAYALRSAREYLANPPESPTKRVLASYYGLMSFLSATLIADPASKYDLGELERATKYGHGLGSMDDDAVVFPMAQKVYVTSNGFLHRYLRHVGVDPKDVNITKRFERVDELTDAERSRLVSLDELLARVPELTEFYFEVTGRPPLVAQVFASLKHMDALGEDMKAAFFGGVARPHKVQWVGLHVPGISPANPDLVTTHLGMPLADVQVEKDPPTNHSYLIGSITVPEGMDHWHEALNLYKSPMCPRSWLRPLLGSIRDPLVLHFCTLYVLSIIVRYRPKLWREITEGDLTAYSALLRSYLSIVDRIVPQLVLARILDREVRCVQPGSFNAPL